MVNLCSNDYLALAADPRLRRAAANAAEREGAGSGAARLVAGDLPSHRLLEARLASFKHAGAALLFGSGYHANCGVIPALVDREDAVFSDRLNHASIVDGCRLSFGRTVRFPHNDLDALERLLATTRARRKLVAVDAVFSMDGDAAPLAEICGLCERHGAMLYVDEAHATGVLGPAGGGLSEALGVSHRVDALMGTLGKALGSYGAFVCGSAALREWLVSRARTFVFTTALPPAACAAAVAALDVVAGEPARRARLSALCEHEEVSLEASRRLRARGFFVRAIRPPTVPPGTSRLRVTLTAGHDEGQVDAFLGALEEVLRELRPGG
jgi:8-amino-7-oxononanoate synthase